MADEFKASEVGERYAKALFELARDEGALDAVRADLKGLRALHAESADLRRLLTSPAFDADAKAAGLNAVAAKAGVHPTTAKFLGLLGQSRRLAALPTIMSCFEALYARHTGVVAAQVTSAQALCKAQMTRIQAALRTALGQDPEIETRVDPALLGGLKVKVGSRLFDASLKTRLDQMKFALKRA